MALKLTMLQKKRTSLKAQEKQLRNKRKTLREEEQKLQKRVDEAEEVTPELEAEVEANTDAITEVDDTLNEVLEQLETVEAQLEDLGAEPAPEAGEDYTRGAGAPAAQRSAAPESRSFRCRSKCFTSRAARDGFYARSDVKEFLGRVRTGLPAAAANKRGVKGAELTIPNVVLDLIRDNLEQYSKLIKFVRLKPVKGSARQNIVGDIPEGVWMEMNGALNNLEFALSNLEFDGFKVGGIIFIDNYLLEDSDIALGEEIIRMLGQAIGLAVDKAIPFGKGGTYKMPTGFVTRLAQQSQPDYWLDDMPDWTDLHSSHIMKLDLASAAGVDFFRALITALGKAHPKYSANGTTTWIMNRTTHMDLSARSLGVNSAAALVAGMNNEMPIIGGEIVELEFMPDHQIVGGFLDNYMLAEREGASFAASSEYKFGEDKTAYKATARYDGQPLRGESFVAVSYDNTNVVTAIDFAYDYANIRLNTLVVTTSAGAAAKQSVVTVAGKKASSGKLMYILGAPDGIESGDIPGDGWIEFTSGATLSKVDNGVGITVVETDAEGKVVSKGFANAVAHA